jgi:AbrB family looped-hinge helix DNA binding protein
MPWPTGGMTVLVTCGAPDAGSSDVTFGRDGKPYYINGPRDDTYGTMAKLRRAVGDGNFDYLGRGGYPGSVPSSMGPDWYDILMEAVVDQAGRIVLPKFIRDALGLLPGTRVDISPYGAGVQVVPAGRTARLVEEDGVLVSAGDTPVDDDILFGLIDAGRK